ncbi:MAG: helix-turn-helix domain-containing protein [Muribaculaceae bacterium]|nr:helix-turn-helix domain-containing protein [Muribaculaceae bacterium]
MNKLELGEIIKARRKKLNLDQPTLATLAGIGLNTLVAIERGNGNPTIETILSVLDTMGLTVDIKFKD